MTDKNTFRINKQRKEASFKVYTRLKLLGGKINKKQYYLREGRQNIWKSNSKRGKKKFPSRPENGNKV